MPSPPPLPHLLLPRPRQRPAAALLVLLAAGLGAPSPLLPAARAAEAAVDCSEYQGSFDLPGTEGSITMEYVVQSSAGPVLEVLAPARASDPAVSASGAGAAAGRPILKARLRRRGVGYLALGVPEDPNCTLCMVGSTAIVGVPSFGVRKYDINGYQPHLTTMAPPARQTLLNPSVEVDEDGNTVVEFSMFLDEPGEAVLDASGGGRTSKFIWAIGEDTGRWINMHSMRGAFELPLRTCTETDGGVGDGKAKVVAEQQSALWTSHAVLAGLAWGVLAPLAVSASWVRDLLPAGGVWYRTHLYANALASLLTVVAFGVAVGAYWESGRPHFAGGTHQSMGLAMMVLLFGQVLFGLLRPPAAPMAKAPPEASHSTEAFPNEGSEKDGVEKPPAMVEAKAPSKPLLRVMWEVGHRANGVALLGCGFWQCHSGLLAYQRKFSESGASPVGLWAFWGSTIGLGSLTLMLKAYAKFCLKRKGEID